jgi:hypothetical protein
MDAVERARAGHDESRRMVEQPLIDQMIGGVISEVLQLCDWRLDRSR